MSQHAHLESERRFYFVQTVFYDQALSKVVASFRDTPSRWPNSTTPSYYWGYWLHPLTDEGLNAAKTIAQRANAMCVIPQKFGFRRGDIFAILRCEIAEDGTRTVQCVDIVGDPNLVAEA